MLQGLNNSIDEWYYFLRTEDITVVISHDDLGATTAHIATYPFVDDDFERTAFASLRLYRRCCRKFSRRSL